MTRSSGVNGLVGVRSERRIEFAADELPLDILALLVSCGHHIRAEDAQALNLDRLSEGANAATANFQAQRVVAEDGAQSSLVVESEPESSPH